MAGRGTAIRAAFFFFFLIFSSTTPYFCLSAGSFDGANSSFSSGGGARGDQTGQYFCANHTSIRRQVVGRGVPRASVSTNSAGGRGTLAGASGGGTQPHGTSLVPVVYGAAAAGAAARSHQGKHHKSSSVSNYCHGSDLLLTAWAAFSNLLL